MYENIAIDSSIIMCRQSQASNKYLSIVEMKHVFVAPILTQMAKLGLQSSFKLNYFINQKIYIKVFEQNFVIVNVE